MMTLWNWFQGVDAFNDEKDDCPQDNHPQEKSTVERVVDRVRKVRGR